MDLLLSLGDFLLRFERWLGPLTALPLRDGTFLHLPGAIVPEPEDRAFPRRSA